MRLVDLDYPLPPELIAQEPAPERRAARLFVLDRGTRGYRHLRVSELPGCLKPGDLLVLNDTRPGARWRAARGPLRPDRGLSARGR